MWLGSVVDSLEQLYDENNLPDLPEPDGERPRARDRRGLREAERAGRARSGRTADKPKDGDAKAKSPDPLSASAREAIQRRRFIIGGGAFAVVIVIVVIVALSSGGGSDNKDKTTSSAADTTQTSTTASNAKLIGQLALKPVDPKDKTDVGIAQFASDGKNIQIGVQAKLPKSKAKHAYEVWLYNSQADAVSLGAQQVGANGTFSGANTLPAGYEKYKYIDISDEPINSDKKHSGNSILRGALADIVTPQEQQQAQGGSGTNTGPTRRRRLSQPASPLLTGPSGFTKALPAVVRGWPQRGDAQDMNSYSKRFAALGTIAAIGGVAAATAFANPSGSDDTTTTAATTTAATTTSPTTTTEAEQHHARHHRRHHRRHRADDNARSNTNEHRAGHDPGPERRPAEPRRERRQRRRRAGARRERDNGVDGPNHDVNDDRGNDPAGHDANDDDSGPATAAAATTAAAAATRPRRRREQRPRRRQLSPSPVTRRTRRPVGDGRSALDHRRLDPGERLVQLTPRRPPQQEPPTDPVPPAQALRQPQRHAGGGVSVRLDLDLGDRLLEDRLERRFGQLLLPGDPVRLVELRPRVVGPHRPPARRRQHLRPSGRRALLDPHHRRPPARQVPRVGDQLPDRLGRRLHGPRARDLHPRYSSS